MWIMLHNIHILSLVLHFLKTLCSKAACIAEYCTTPVRCHAICCVVQSSVPVRDKAIPSIQRVKEIMVGHLHHGFFEEKKQNTFQLRVCRGTFKWLHSKEFSSLHRHMQVAFLRKGEASAPLNDKCPFSFVQRPVKAPDHSWSR